MCAMDAKLNQSRLSSDAPIHQASKKKPAFSFVQELKEELKKVSWTTKNELKLSTQVVVGATFLFGLGIYLFDLVIKGALDFIALFVHFIFG
jgi:preprotein translocase subunit SecE